MYTLAEDFINRNYPERDSFQNKFDLEDYGINLAKKDNKIIVDTLKWNGAAKKSGMETGDIISEFKVENLSRPSKSIVYPIALVLLLIFGYLNYRRKTVNHQNLI